jgi:outer membrane lipoprotein SlyB
MRRVAALIPFALLALACASPRPVLYPNAALERAGREQAQRDVDACLARAEADVGGEGDGAGERIAKGAAERTATGAATGAAVGAAVGRGAARGAAGGAAGAAAHTAVGAILHPHRARGGPDPVFRRYVDRCLNERGYDVIGWRRP